ncbi:MAG: TetR/AcrR family transcriptional regulator [Anaerovoracaceae bacterium]
MAIDRRIGKTKKILKDGLISLLMVKPFEQITVKELAEKVDINRGTFYLHFNDINDLLNYIGIEMIDGLRLTLKKIQKNGADKSMLPYLTEILQFLHENFHVCKAFSKQEHHVDFIKQLKQVIIADCFSSIQTTYNINAGDPSKLPYLFAVSGTVSVIEAWLDDDCREPISEIAVSLSNLLEIVLKYADNDL